MENVSVVVRKIHRYLGFLLMVIMAIYAISGIVLVYRDTNMFKYPVHIEKTLSVKQTEPLDLGTTLKIKNFKVTKTEGDIIYFEQGSYNKVSRVADYTVYVYPKWLQSLVDIHKSNSTHRYSWLTTIFGVCLLFFALSAFWMFPMKSKFFKQGRIFMVGGILLALLVLLF